MKQLFTVVNDSGRTRLRWLSWATLGLLLALLGLRYYCYFSLYYFLPRAVPAMLQAQLGEAGAVQLIKQGRKLYFHYYWKGEGCRAGHDEIIATGGQQCDGAVSMLQKLLPELEVKQVDLATTDDIGVTHGHSIAMIERNGMRVYIDPSFGLVWLAAEGSRGLLDDLLNLNGLSRIGRPTPIFDHKLGGFPKVYYDNMRKGRFHAALPDEPLNLYYPLFQFGDIFKAGVEDGSNDDIARNYGSYQASLGSGNRPVIQLFSFRGAGDFRLLKFQLTKAECEPLQFDVSAREINGVKSLQVPNEAGAVFVFLRRINGWSQLSITPHHRTLGGRGIDAISVTTRFWDGERPARQLQGALAEGRRVIAGTGPIEIRNEQTDLALFPLELEYWGRCIVEFVPLNQSADYFLVYGDGQKMRELPMQISGFSRYAIIYVDEVAAASKGILGIVGQDGRWLKNSDLQVFRAMPAESGASFFTLQGDRSAGGDRQGPAHK